MKRLGVFAAVAVLLACAPAAHAALYLSADATAHRGLITLYAIGSEPLGTVTFGEGDGATGTTIGSLPLAPWRVDPTDGPMGTAVLTDGVRWSCHELDRHFWVTAGTERADFTVRTPSCRNRLTLGVPRRATHGRVKLTVTDTWTIGGTSPRVCFRGHCRTVVLHGGVARKTTTFRGRRGTVTLRDTDQKLTEHVPARGHPRPGGPTVLTTGDSMMQSTDAILADDLARRANVVSDVHIGATLSNNFIVNWRKLARRQVADDHPNATVIFLGTNDAFRMTTPTGEAFDCCGDGWLAEYARRVHAVMQTYAQHGDATVIWLTVPIARDPKRATPQFAVNQAIVEAAKGLPTVRVVRADDIFTPGGVYRDRMDGKVVREPDGLHLSIPGARIAVAAIIAELKRAGLL